MQDAKFTAASDVWSYGITLVEIWMDGAIPYPEMNTAEVASAVQSGQVHDKVPQCSDAIYEIMKLCWSSDPNDRPSFSELERRIRDLNPDPTVLRPVVPSGVQ